MWRDPCYPTQFRELVQACGIGLVLILCSLFGLIGCHTTPRQPISQTELGRQIYFRRCQSCHQTNGQGFLGSRQVAADLTISTGVMAQPDTILVEKIKMGITGPIGRMPSLAPVLSDQEIATTLAYIRQKLID